jgi:16S rRNA (cytidine1402-2'-O)-methyltransferase
MQIGKVYLIPNELYANAIHTIPTYVIDAIKDCQVFFVENEKTTRRFFKKIWKEIIIDHYEWHTIHKTENQEVNEFVQILKSGKNIGIVSDAGCPGIADPGQMLIAAAQQINAVIKPLVGPSSILLALMASGMNGQCFKFNGYLPIDNINRKKKIKELEMESYKTACTQIFIETPYRNNQLINDVLITCNNETKFCIAYNITDTTETICTKTISDWKKNIPNIHKHTAIYLINAVS